LWNSRFSYNPVAILIEENGYYATTALENYKKLPSFILLEDKV
jgi:hypothetical protein